MTEPSELDREQLLGLARHSVKRIRASQDTGGAYLASPNFPVYRFSWLRDGAFIADAMSRAGKVASAEAFFGWCADVVVARRDRIASLLARRARDEPIETAEFLHTRYTVDGRESGEDWTDFQLDGYGAWLWALGLHRRRHGLDVGRLMPGAELSARYVEAFWDHPSYDWWEEHPDHRHTSTLAALYAGLDAASEWPELESDRRQSFAQTAAIIRETVLAEARRIGHLPKWLGGLRVDASLTAAGIPFGLVRADHPLMLATIAMIEAGLVHGGGVHRYADDTYYGGGEWLLLAAFLGWHYARIGRTADARRQLAWVASHATPDGDLPEQTSECLLTPAARQAWIDRWGPVATPLLWSHAMFLTLALELEVVKPAELRDLP